LIVSRIASVAIAQLQLQRQAGIDQVGEGDLGFCGFLELRALVGSTRPRGWWVGSRVAFANWSATAWIYLRIEQWTCSLGANC
jgi:hypothetical protein